MKREAIGHTKMKRLCRKLDIPLWQGVGLLESIWHLTAREAPRGDIGKLSNEDIAIAIDYRGDEGPMMEALIYCGWLDVSGEYRIVVHDWNEHADDSVHMKLARTNQFFVRTDCSFVRPKTGRLPSKERESAEKWYSVHTPCAQNEVSCASPALALALAFPSQAKPSPVPPPVHTWQSDAPFSKFVVDYKSTGASVIDEDFTEAFQFGWKPLDWEQKAERVKALAERLAQFSQEPAFVPKPVKFLKQEWKRPLRPPVNGNGKQQTPADPPEYYNLAEEKKKLEEYRRKHGLI